MGSDDGDDGNVGRDIMLLAIFSLFAVVILTIILHIYAKYLIRREERRRRTAASASIYNTQTTRVAPSDVDEVLFSISTEPPPKTGLNPSVIASLPEFIYKPNDELGRGEAIECSVCLSTLVEETTVRLLPNCKHIFHGECIDTWLRSNTTCPICRTLAEPRAAAQPSAPPIEAAQLEKASGSSGSRLSSFRRMLTGERSSSRGIQGCGDDHQVRAEDLERQ